jgi:hypothetical protein
MATVVTDTKPSTCKCGFDTKLNPRTSAYHRVHKANHLAVYPDADAETIRNLDTLIGIFEIREAA